MPDKKLLQSTQNILCRTWAWWVLVLFSQSSLSHADNLIVLSRQLNSYQIVADTIRNELDTPSRTVTLAELEVMNFNTEGYEQLIAVGSKAADNLLKHSNTNQKLILTFLPRQTFLSLKLKYKQHPKFQHQNVTAVFLDQPYSRQLALARLISPQAKNIATVLGPNSQNDLALLTAAAEKYNFVLQHKTLHESDNPIHKLQPLIKQADIFLSLPDKSVFNRTTAKWVLYITFRQRIPLIGFSQKYVQAGALAAVYSTPKEIGLQTAEIVQSNQGHKTLPPANHPIYYTVAINETAAQTLRIPIPSADELTQRLKELGNE